MKLTGVIAFAAAALFHALLLFGFRAGSMARPLPLGGTPESLDVTLVDAEPQAVVAPATPEPTANAEPTPEPIPTPPAPAATPLPQIEPEPAPTQPVPTPEPKPTISPTSSTPSQVRPAKASAAKQPARHTDSNPQPVPQRSVVSQWFHCWDSAPGTASQNARPRYRSNPRPKYPEEARRKGQQGVVLVTVQVETDGRPSHVTLKQSSGFPLLDAAALEAVRKWTFDPARPGGLPVASSVDLPVRFGLEDR